jgi:hypothetical protein
LDKGLFQNFVCGIFIIHFIFHIYSSLLKDNKKKNSQKLMTDLNGQFTRTMNIHNLLFFWGGRRGRDRMVLGFTTTCAISAYHH